MSAKELDQLLDLLEFVQRDGRVCPMPSKWDEFYKSLPNLDAPAARELPVPHILALADADPETKRRVLMLQILWAATNGALHKAERFLTSLADEDWHWWALGG
jgi:hypothetical protein